MRFKLYLKNAVLLTAGGFALRLLGMAFRVYIAGYLGSEGMGLYQLILAVYGVFIALSSAGINVASTRLAAQSLARGREMAQTLWGLVGAAACLGTAAMLAQFALAPVVARWALHDMRAELGLRVLAPSLPFLAVAGALRGCFLARRRVGPNILAQLAEQAVRMLVAAMALALLAGWGAGYACAAVLIGNTVSEACSCLLMACFAGREPAFRPRPSDPVQGFARRELWAIALPVGGNRLLVSILQAVESSLIPMCLTLHLGQRGEAVAQYGALKGMALPLIFFPFSMLSAMSGLLMPEIARAHTRKDKTAEARLIDTTMRTAGLFSAVAGAGLILFGEPLATLVYREEAVGLYVSLLGWVAPFMYLESMVDGILKGLGEQLATFRYAVLDSGVRILAAVLLVPRYGALGFLGMMAISNLMTCLLNTARMLRCTRMRPRPGAWLLVPAAVVGLGALATLATRQVVSSGMAGLVAQLAVFGAGAGVPAVFLFVKNRDLVRQVRRRHTGTGPVRTP